MAFTKDQKKHLLIGGGVGALTLWVGSWIFGSRTALAGPRLPGGHPSGGDHHHEKKRRRDHGDDEHEDNGRGEYGRKKKHKGHDHGD